MSRLIYTVHVVGEDGVNTVAFGPDSQEIPDWAVEKIGAHAFEDGEKPTPKEKKAKKDKKSEKKSDDKSGGDAGDSKDEGNDDDTVVVPYAKRLKADLQADVDARNQGRDEGDLIAVGGKGTVADLAAALEADDAAQA